MGSEKSNWPAFAIPIRNPAAANQEDGLEPGFGSPGRAKTGGEGWDKASLLRFRKETRGREGLGWRRGRRPTRAREGVLPCFDPEEEQTLIARIEGISSTKWEMIQKY